MKTRSQSAFTLIEMLVVISIIAVLAAFAVPALTSALTKGQMTGTLNNGRQIYLASQQMALDGAANSDPLLCWPGDDATIATVTDYCNRLFANDYLKPGDLQKLLNAPGTATTVTFNAAAPPNPATVTLAGSPAFKWFKVKDADSANVVFLETANYTYNAALPAGTAPFGDKGFIVQRRGGDASLLRKNNAQAGANQAIFQGTVGKQTGDPDGTVNAEAPGNLLTFP
ncbi:MAG TPA: type II secretion system protein [Chthoniobacterales bacterium]|jgi:prepilin-type N-terminal cleavage/methylation domain-containing protein|nr:type II secretion system protein [Chthoniobacterales bacterium]